MKTVCLVLLSLALIASCSGQEETRSVKAIRYPKMIKTQGMRSGNVNCQLQDRNGNIWFSTDGEGIFCFNGTSFNNFTMKDGLPDNNTGSIIQDKAGNILVATGRGICRYNGTSFVKYFAADSLDQLGITCLFEDKDGNLWFGTMGSGIYCYDGKTCRNFLNNDDHPFNLGNHYQLIIDIVQDKNGNLWFASWNGGGVWRYDGKTFTNYLPPRGYYLSNEDERSGAKTGSGSFTSYFLTSNTGYPRPDSITDDMIAAIAEDKVGNLWFATRRHGACRYDGKTFAGFREGQGFVSYGIRAILEDKKGNLWFGTDKNGVYCYDGNTFRNFTTADGLVNNSVWSILEDRDGNLWLGTRWFGLSRYDGKSFVTFSDVIFKE